MISHLLGKDAYVSGNAFVAGFFRVFTGSGDFGQAKVIGREVAVTVYKFQPPTFKIVRHFRVSKAKRTVKKGLSWEDVKAYIASKENTSRTSRSALNKRRTRRHGPWTDRIVMENS